MVADALIYHPTVSHYLKFLSTTIGRDKLLRTIQYFARFYAWYLLRTNAANSSVTPFNLLKAQLGLTRKLLRVGKNVEHLKAAAAASDAKSMDPVLRYATIGRQLGYAGYLSFDMATVLDTIKVRPWAGAKRAGQEAYRFWAMGLACSVVAQVYTLWRLKQREARIDRKDGEGVVESKRITKYVAPGYTQTVRRYANQKLGNAPSATCSLYLMSAISQFPSQHLAGLRWMTALSVLPVPRAVLLASTTSGRRQHKQTQQEVDKKSTCHV